MENAPRQVLEYSNKRSGRTLGSLISWGSVLFGFSALVTIALWFTSTRNFHRPPQLHVGLLPYVHITNGVPRSYVIDWGHLAISVAITLLTWIVAALLFNWLVRRQPDERWARRRKMRRFGSRSV